MKKRVLVISLVLLTLLTVALMTSCDEEGFGDIRGLSYKLKDDGTYAVDIGWSKYMPLIDIPAEYNGKPVTEVISSVGEAKYSLLKEITIPSTVTRVQKDAFAGCPIEKANVPTCAINAIRNEELKTLVINGGSIIYGGAFNECEKLKSVTIYEDVEIVENASFWGGSVEEADIPIHALRGFSTVTLKNVTIRGEGEIPHGAFRYFNEINSITVGSGITEIADGAFQYVSETVSVNVSPDNPAFMAIDNVIYTKDGTELVTEQVRRSIESVLSIEGKDLDYEALFSDKRSLLGI